MSATPQAIPQAPIQVSEGISTAVLLYLLLFSVTGSITASNWSDDLGLLTFAAASSASLGIIVAKFRQLSGFLAHLIALVLSVPCVGLFGTSVFPASLTLQEKFVILAERVTNWLIRVAGGATATDNLIFVLQLSLLIWFIGYFAAWSIYRQHQVWGALVPTGLAIIVNLFYAAPQTGLYIGLYLLSALLLLVRLNLQAMEIKWRNATVGYSPDISFDFLYYGALFTIMLLFIVWLLPGAAPGPTWFGFLEPLQKPWQVVEEQFTRMFGNLRGVPRPASAFAGNTLALGGAINLSQRPVLQVETAYPRYLRAMVYDKYADVAWTSTQQTTIIAGANESPWDAPDDLRAPVTQTIKFLLNDQYTLYAQAQPVRFDLPIQVSLGKSPAPDSHLDLTVAQSRRPLHSGSTYQVVSSISIADEESLRAASTQYPGWISGKYLQLPDELPARVRALAQDITAPFNNPYDKAVALEQYARKKIKYNEQISAPPTDRDAVDYTLFDRPEGYCNYYASATAVMARAVGIPARLVSGFSIGEYQNGIYQIVEANSHAWVEIYFPRYGWVEFEPTANKLEIKRPARQSQSAPENSDLENAASEARRRQERERGLEDNFDPGTNSPTSFIWNNPNNLSIIIGGIIGLMALVAASIRLARQAQRNARLAPAARMYERMLNRARWLGIRDETFATPLERAQTIGQKLTSVQLETDHIAAAYTRERFSAQKLSASEKSVLVNAWRKWQLAWWRGLAAQTRTQLLKPIHALAETLRGWQKRWEHLSTE